MGAGVMLMLPPINPTDMAANDEDCGVEVELEADVDVEGVGVETFILLFTQLLELPCGYCWCRLSCDVPTTPPLTTARPLTLTPLLLLLLLPEVVGVREGVGVIVPIAAVEVDKLLVFVEEDDEEEEEEGAAGVLTSLEESREEGVEWLRWCCC